MRDAAALKVVDRGSPIDVLWLRLPAKPGDPTQPVGRFGAGHMFVMLYRGDYWQCAFVIPKGAFEGIKTEGIAKFQERLKNIAGFASDRVDSIKSFDDVSLLTVKIDRLEHWATDGFLCIGDAAHAMSPVGGVGINLAIQDAVAAANLLAPILAKGKSPKLANLDRVQRRREWPAKVVQGFQVFIQNRVIARGLKLKAQPKPPFVLLLLDRWSWLRQFPARFLGLGVRPEHIRTKDVLAGQAATTLRTD